MRRMATGQEFGVGFGDMGDLQIGMLFPTFLQKNTKKKQLLKVSKSAPYTTRFYLHTVGKIILTIGNKLYSDLVPFKNLEPCGLSVFERHSIGI